MTINTSRIRNYRERAAARRALAYAALASDCSEAKRYHLYHAHMRAADALSRAADLKEGNGEAQA